MIEKWNEVMKELNSSFKWLRITLNYGFLKPQDWIHDFNWILISFAKFWSLWNCNGMFQISFRFLNSLKNLGDSKIKKLFYDWSEILKYFGDFSSVLLEIFEYYSTIRKFWKKTLGSNVLIMFFINFCYFYGIIYMFKRLCLFPNILLNFLRLCVVSPTHEIRGIQRES